MFSKKFWENFVREYWKKQPGVFHSVHQPLIQTEEQIYEGLLDVSATLREGKVATIRFYIEHSSLQVNLLEYLPLPADGSLTNYLQRIRGKVDNRSFALVTNKFHLHQPNLWLCLRQIFYEFYLLVGIPEDTVVAAFVGNYATTPFGVHTDSDSTFYFILKGHKRVHLWPYEFAKEHNAPWPQRVAGGSTDYLRYLDEAITLEGNPGDLLYWPAHYWHVAESDDCDSVTLSIGMPKPSSCFVGDMLAEKIRERIPNYTEMMHSVLMSPAMYDKLVLPAPIVRAKKEYENTLSNMNDDLQEHWLNRISSLGYRYVPTPRTWVSLLDHDWLTAIPGSLVCFQRAEQEFLCSSLGHSFRLPYHPKLKDLLNCIAKGGRWQVIELFKKYTDEALTERGLRTLLEKLNSLRVISVEKCDRPQTAL